MKHPASNLIIYFLLNVILILFAYTMYQSFATTKQNLVDNSLKENLRYTSQIARNIEREILSNTDGDIIESLQAKPRTRRLLNGILHLFITDKYRYIYLIGRKNKNYLFLLDGSKDNDKADFMEFFEPFNAKAWQKAFTTGQDLSFQHKELKGLWTTYLHPILRDGKVRAVLSIDFSMHEYQSIQQNLYELDRSYKIALWVFAGTFALILFLSYLDYKREKEKHEAYRQLSLKNEEISRFNETLQEKIAQAIEKNRQQEQLLQQQARLAQMGEMISMIAHQWRQPLSAINSAIIAIKMKLDLKRFDLSDEKGRKECLDFITSQHRNVMEYVKFLSTTIDDFRNFFKSDKVKESVMLDIPIDRAIGIVEASMKSKGITLHKEYRLDKPVAIYPNEMMQVVLNILKNSEDNFIEKEIKNGQIWIKTYLENDRAILTIEDNGTGIPEEILPKIFDPYFSTKKEKNGTGIGLYMSKAMIEKHHNGRIIASNTARGALFTIILPLT